MIGSGDTVTRPAVDLMDKITSLSKRRGFVFPSSEIYGGVASTWDYAPLGVELKNNIKRAWWRSLVQLRDDVGVFCGYPSRSSSVIPNQETGIAVWRTVTDKSLAQ